MERAHPDSAPGEPAGRDVFTLPARADSAEQESVGDERYTPIATEVTLSAMPAVGRQASVTIVVSSTHPAPGTEVNIVQAGLPDVIPPEACYLGWQQSLRNLARLVEPEINQ